VEIFQPPALSFLEVQVFIQRSVWGRKSNPQRI